jgi:hypothetical protein
MVLAHVAVPVAFDPVDLPQAPTDLPQDVSEGLLAGLASAPSESPAEELAFGVLDHR